MKFSIRPVAINNKLINCWVNKNKVGNFVSLDKFTCVYFVVRPLHTCLDERMTKFLHAVVSECNLRAVTFDWLPRLGGRGTSKPSYRGGQLNFHVFRSSWLWPTIVEIENVAGKLVFLSPSTWTRLGSRRHETLSFGRDVRDT